MERGQTIKLTPKQVQLQDALQMVNNWFWKSCSIQIVPMAVNSIFEKETGHFGGMIRMLPVISKIM